MALPTDVALKLAALLADLTAFGVEDLAAIRSIETLGPVIADNVANLQATSLGMDKATIDLINEERVRSGLPAV